jgi:hypothetical protein
MPTEYEYFAAQSGLTAGTLSDHMYAYYVARSGLVGGITAGSCADHQLAFFKLQTGNTMHDMGWQRLTYYRNRAGDQTLGIDAARAATFGIYNAAQKARLLRASITAA